MRFKFPRPLLLCWGALSHYVWMELLLISALVPLYVLCAIYPSSSDVFMFCSWAWITMIMMGGSDDTVYLGRWLRSVFRLTWNGLME